jgi:hypothetical protein
MATKAKAERVAVENFVSPGRTYNVDAKKYHAMRTTLLKVLPKKAPGLTAAEMLAKVKEHAPESEFPGGEKAGWWMKCVQLDLEAKGTMLREVDAKPLRWHKTI